MAIKREILQKSVLTVVVLSLTFYYFIYKGDNRITIWLHHGIWLPPTTEKIDFYTCPGPLTHLIALDDWAKTSFELPISEISGILKDKEYQYVTKIEANEDSSVVTTHMSGYQVIPDSIINQALPLSVELKSTRGDFLMFYAEERTDSMAFVYLYTDWN